MIRSVQIAGYRSLDKVAFELAAPSSDVSHGLTVLVGTNSAGKSALLDVFRFTAQALEHGLEVALAERRGFAELLTDTSDVGTLSLTYDVDLDGRPWRWQFAIKGDRKGEVEIDLEMLAPIDDPAWLEKLQQPGSDGKRDLTKSLALLTEVIGQLALGAPAFERRGSKWTHVPKAGREPEIVPQDLALPQMARFDSRFHPLLKHLTSVATYDLEPAVMRLPQAVDPSHPMRRRGENWASTLRSVLRANHKGDLVAALARVSGDIDDIRTTSTGGFLIPEFHHSTLRPRGRWSGAANESDGTLRVAGLLTALLQKPLPGLIGIEEPELAVHPGALPILVDFIRQAATQTQVVLTTHSPELLDLVPSESIRVVERNKGLTTVSALADDQREVLRQRSMSTGELMRSEGLRASEPAHE